MSIRPATSQAVLKRNGDAELVNLQRRYRCIQTLGKNELPAIPPKPSDKLAKYLQERFKADEAPFLGCPPKIPMSRFPISQRNRI